MIFIKKKTQNSWSVANARFSSLLLKQLPWLFILSEELEGKWCLVCKHVTLSRQLASGCTMFSSFIDWFLEYFVAFAAVLSLGLTQRWCARYAGDTNPHQNVWLLLCVMHSTEGAFWGRAIFSIACWNRDCYLAPLEESWCQTLRLKWK